MSVVVANPAADLAGKTLLKREDPQTIIGLKTFDLGAAAPFACMPGSALVQHLKVDAALLQGSIPPGSITTIPPSALPNPLNAESGNFATLLTTTDLWVKGNAVFDGTTFLGNNAADLITVKGTLYILAPIRRYSEVRVVKAIDPDTGLRLDCDAGSYFYCPLDQSCTVVLQNPPAAGGAFGVTIIFVAQGNSASVFWQAGVQWPHGTPPVITNTPAGRKDIVTLITENGGNTWYGVIVGQNYPA